MHKVTIETVFKCTDLIYTGLAGMSEHCAVSFYMHVFFLGGEGMGGGWD